MPDPASYTAGLAALEPAAETFRRELAEKITRLGEAARRIQALPVMLPTRDELAHPYLSRRDS